MILVYSLMNRDMIFAMDPNFSKMSNNSRTAYTYQRWEQYGYLDYVPYADYLNDLALAGEIDEETRSAAVSIGRTADKDGELAAEYVKKFTEAYESRGYEIIRLDAVTTKRGRLSDGGQQMLFATRDVPLWNRLWEYFSGMIAIDNIHYVPENVDIGERKLTFTLHDPLYGGEKFAPAIIGNGTYHKYLLYVDDKFPYLHQNLAKLHLGVSYTVNMGVDVADTMSKAQGSYVNREMTFPTGLTEQSADNLHTATYVQDSRDSSPLYADRFTDDYTNVETFKSGKSRLGYSFIIGIISVILSYALGLPIGLLMALQKDKLVDKLGTVYIVFVIAVPSLAYIFLIKSVGGKLGLPNVFNMDSSSKLMYILPVVSLALPSIANLMKWMRRYMIDQMNADYVKFARSGGLSETEIFTKHIWKNAAIPIMHGIPGSVIFAMTGAIITERVYSVPGTGNLLTQAINRYDNGVIVGVTLFYAVLSVVSLTLGDILMAMVDPRISFSTKGR